jgi:hypothetical protein
MVMVALISCVSQKVEVKSLARDMYISALFKKSLKYVETILKPNKCFILSAKYGLLPLDKEIEPYNCTLLKMTRQEKSTWADKVWVQLQGECDTAKDKFIFLAGTTYYEELIPRLKYYEVLMEGLTIGRRLQWLNAHLKYRKELDNG